jgi:hypothetical protein
MAAVPNKNTYKASICLGHVLDFECAKEPGNVILRGKFEFTLVTGAEETPEIHKELVIMRGIDTFNKRLKECACTEDWLVMLDCSVCPTTGLDTHTANVRGEYGRGSDTMQEPGDILMSVDYKFALVTGPEETPETHKTLVMRVIDELHKALEESACAPDFWKQAS